MDGVSLNLGQLLFFFVTGLVGLALKNLNDKFIAIKEDYNSKILAMDSAFKERLLQVQKEYESRARDRSSVYDGRFSTFEQTLAKIDTQLLSLGKEMKEMNITMAKLSMLEESMLIARRRPTTKESSR